MVCRGQAVRQPSQGKILHPTGIGIIFRLFAETSFNRVLVNISNDCQKISVIVHGLTLKAILKQVSYTLVLDIVPIHEASTDTLKYLFQRLCTFLDQQIEVFDRQVRWALELDLPIVVHCREAIQYIYKVLLPYKDTALRGIFHSFTGDPVEAELMLQFKRFMIGVNGIVTFKKSVIPTILPQLPIERLVLETDSPYLTPVPHRGERNESSYIGYTLMKVAQVLGCKPEELAVQTSENALRLFGG